MCCTFVYSVINLTWNKQYVFFITDINNYCICFLKMLQFEVRNVKIKSILFVTKQYLFEISQNYIVKCFSSQFVLNFCTWNDIKLIIFHSKWYKIEYFRIQLVQNRGYIILIKILFKNWGEINISYIKQSQINNLKLWLFTYVI